MGIDESRFSSIWVAIGYWLRKRKIEPRELANRTDLTLKQIENGLVNRDEWITSEFLHNCVELFGLQSTRMRGMEDAVDIFDDEECIELLVAPLIIPPQETKFW